MAWLLLGAAAAATLVPLWDRPVTPVGAPLERFIAFAAIGTVFTLAYPRHRLAVAALLSLALAGLEWAQWLAVDRHGRIEDAIEKLAGLHAGLLLAILGLMLVRRLTRRQAP